MSLQLRKIHHGFLCGLAALREKEKQSRKRATPQRNTRDSGWAG
jgi:hypothetical protein